MGSHWHIGSPILKIWLSFLVGAGDSVSAARLAIMYRCHCTRSTRCSVIPGIAAQHFCLGTVAVHIAPTLELGKIAHHEDPEGVLQNLCWILRGCTFLSRMFCWVLLSLGNNAAIDGGGQQHTGEGF